MSSDVAEMQAMGTQLPIASNYNHLGPTTDHSLISPATRALMYLSMWPVYIWWGICIHTYLPTYLPTYVRTYVRSDFSVLLR